ncbi:PHD finger protein 3 isoform X3 [Pipistrellus kuhlii]|uniref:PHD finger protein 3 isoform X3 n=1 Tax=Pipistrellus kuhlii TaxID=59472 RepID=UPI001E26F31B|nr:PHD finger protein 3 isoform X3 [Pipistrellus kuhlii]
MDIVDTFNHLIPTEHLDDALFLGSNLENEVCEDFSTSQNVLEDSLKNMLSDKDPMLGSASNQFCLPVLDSNDPNFQMPCSTEQVRSLRQSTIAKRSNAAPLNSTKKAPVKTVSAPKTGGKQPERCQTKEEACTSPKSEYHKESRRSSRQLEQTEVSEESVPSSHSSVSSCLEMKDEVGLDSKQKCNKQDKANVPSHELNCPLLSETCDSIEEKKNEPLVECKIKTISPLFTFSDKEEHEKNDSISDKVDETMVEEMSAKGKVEQESKEMIKLSHEGDQIVEEPESSAAFCGDANPNKTEKNLVGLSSTVGEVNECHLELKNTREFDQAKNSLHRNELEPLGYCKDIESNHKQLESTEFDKPNFDEVVDTNTFEPECNVENAICDVPDQNLKQLHIVESIEMESHETATLQDVRNSPSNSVSSLESKNIKSKHTKPVIHSKQNTSTDTLKKIVAGKHELMHNKTKASVKSVKRNADELESQQNSHRPVKVRKKQVDKDSKIQSCNSGVKSVKNQAHSNSKKTQDQNLVQISKPVTHWLSDKPHGQPGCSKEPHHPAQTGHLLHSCQKQCHKPQQLAPAVKTNSHAKEELEHAGGAEHFKEEDKLKQKKPEKNLQPRQRRSSKSFSLDEPPLFIPDNIATIKKEGSDHGSSFENKYMWTPSKQCGFCKKPHGNRFMVGCGRCDDWFHGDCVGLSLSQAQQMGEEDKEYVCVKCCAEEDKKTEVTDPDILENQAKVEVHTEDKTMDCEKLGLSKHTSTNDKTKCTDDTVKHKVKILKRESGEGKNSSDCRDSEMKKWQLTPLRKMGQPVLPRRSSEEKSEKIPKDSTTVICTGEKTSKPGAHEKQEVKKKKIEKGSPNVHPPAAPAAKPSADQIRQSVRHSLKDILMKRLTDSNLKVPEEKAAKVATKIEKELFSFFRDTDAKYKNKYRSLMFNLKDPKNNILFKKVLKGEVTPDHLIRMSPEELASKELAAWRRRENRHTIEMIEKEQREVERRPITKITHKGEIEIESDAPMKEQEAVMEIQQEPAGNKSLEKTEGSEKQKEEIDSMSTDTTSQHRQHLFDLNCKICIGRMAPPVDDLSPKKVKVVVGVSRKHSDNEAESIADALFSTSNILASEFFEEEKQESPKSTTFSPAPRPEMPGTVEVESTFLARLNFIWKGFINMPSVAKFVTKAYPVSGSPEYLTEDLPDSIQVGGRISPQTVWDYVEKLKASGTKEICVVRFTPVTEEDQISYTLLFAYFSSRKRYGVAANNMKQVKDMYLIPLGATDKIPHPLVPFDGPGLELHRPNLLLGLIIRQKLKRQHSASASHTAETSENVPVALPPEKKSKTEVSSEEAPEEENDFFNSFTTVLHKQRPKPQQAVQEDLAAVVEPLVEVTKQEPPKPLRFLPGVLIGWENQPSTLELANKPLPVDDILQSLLGTTGEVYEQAQSATEQSTLNEIPFISEQADPKAENVDKVAMDGEAKEVKGKVDNLSESSGNSVPVDEETPGTGPSSISPGASVSLSLRGKPPDVSTEVFLTNLSIQSKQEEVVESKERPLKSQLLQDQEDNLQDNQTSDTSSPCKSNIGKGNTDGSVSGSENLAANTAKSPQFINLKRDPRQAAGRSQQVTASESKEGDSCGNGEKHTLPGPSHKEHSPEQTNAEEKLSSVEKNSSPQQKDNSGFAQNLASEDKPTSQTEQAKPSEENISTQNIETVHPFRRGSAAPPSHFEVENTSQSEFPSKSLNFTSRSSSPRTSANFSPMRPQQPNLQHLKSSPPGFPFPGPPNFPPQGMFGFPPHLPPPLLPPPGFGFAQNPIVPWPPVHLTGQPQRMMGPLSQTSRYVGPPNFFQTKDIRRPERRHSDPWGNRQDQQQPDRSFNRGKGDRQRFYSDSHHMKRERHEKEWEQESERHRRRDRSQDKDRDRKSREEGHKDKERPRLSHSDRGTDGKASRDGRNVDKKPDKPKTEDHEKDKEREKSKHREGEKDRDRYHKDRDHTDRAKSKR